MPAPWGSATFWQYDDNGTVSGVPGNVDVDRFFGSAGDLARFTAGPPPDAGVMDAPYDSARPDADTPPAMNNAGCGCDTTGSLPAASVALAALLVVQYRRRAQVIGARRKILP